MEPNQRALAGRRKKRRQSPRYQPQAFPQPFAIFVLGGHSPKPPWRADHKRYQQCYVIEKENHTQPNLLSAGLTYRLRNNSLFSKGHGFSRAVNGAKSTGPSGPEGYFSSIQPKNLPFSAARLAPKDDCNKTETFEAIG
jgi:hypothetical protein